MRVSTAKGQQQCTFTIAELFFSIWFRPGLEHLDSGPCMEANSCFVFCPSPSQLSTFRLLYNRDREKEGLSDLSCISCQSARLMSVYTCWQWEVIYRWSKGTHFPLQSLSKGGTVGMQTAAGKTSSGTTPLFSLETSPSLCKGQPARKPLLTQLLVPAGATREC